MLKVTRDAEEVLICALNGEEVFYRGNMFEAASIERLLSPQSGDVSKFSRQLSGKLDRSSDVLKFYADDNWDLDSKLEFEFSGQLRKLTKHWGDKAFND